MPKKNSSAGGLLPTHKQSAALTVVLPATSSSIQLMIVVCI
jgi:hypothetical protein